MSNPLTPARALAVLPLALGVMEVDPARLQSWPGDDLLGPQPASEVWPEVLPAGCGLDVRLGHVPEPPVELVEGPLLGAAYLQGAHLVIHPGPRAVGAEWLTLRVWRHGVSSTLYVPLDWEACVP